MKDRARRDREDRSTEKDGFEGGKLRVRQRLECDFDAPCGCMSTAGPVRVEGESPVFFDN